LAGGANRVGASRKKYEPRPVREAHGELPSVRLAEEFLFSVQLFRGALLLILRSGK
jgi:hypothetical protein